MGSSLTTGLLHAILLDAKGSGRLLSWDELRSWNASMGALWLHFDYTFDIAREWFGNGKARLRAAE